MYCQKYNISLNYVLTFKLKQIIVINGILKVTCNTQKLITGIYNLIKEVLETKSWVPNHSTVTEYILPK